MRAYDKLLITAGMIMTDGGIADVIVDDNPYRRGAATMLIAAGSMIMGWEARKDYVQVSQEQQAAAAARTAAQQQLEAFPDQSINS